MASRSHWSVRLPIFPIYMYITLVFVFSLFFLFFLPLTHHHFISNPSYPSKTRMHNWTESRWNGRWSGDPHGLRWPHPLTCSRPYFFFIYYFFFFFVFPPPNYKLIRIKEEEKKNKDARTQVKDDRSYVTITNRCLPCWHAKTSLSDLIAKEKNAPFLFLSKIFFLKERNK